jgi:hypothetical protein
MITPLLGDDLVDQVHPRRRDSDINARYAPGWDGCLETHEERPPSTKDSGWPLRRNLLGGIVIVSLILWLSALTMFMLLR